MRAFFRPCEIISTCFEIIKYLSKCKARANLDNVSVLTNLLRNFVKNPSSWSFPYLSYKYLALTACKIPSPNHSSVSFDLFCKGKI